MGQQDWLPYKGLPRGGPASFGGPDSIRWQASRGDKD